MKRLGTPIKVRLSESQRQNLNVLAEKRQTTVSDLVRDAIADYVWKNSDEIRPRT